MSLAIDPLALDRVCGILDLGPQFSEIVLVPTQKNPVGICVVDQEDGLNMITIIINSELDRRDANYIALHELKHAAQEIHEEAQSGGKYAEQVVAAGFDPAIMMQIDRGDNWMTSPEDRERYNQIPYEKDANDFAYSMEDLYQVVVDE